MEGAFSGSGPSAAYILNHNHIVKKERYSRGTAKHLKECSLCSRNCIVAFVGTKCERVFFTLAENSLPVDLFGLMHNALPGNFSFPFSLATQLSF